MFRRTPKLVSPPTWMIVGLGNPGPEYRGTRHNVGFELVDILAEKHRIKLDRSKHKARYGIGTVSDTCVLLVKPLTYMNLSGHAVAPLAKEYGLAPDHILVVADDTDIAPGRLRLRPDGSAGGHNGHKSLIQSLGTAEYPRLKIGIGRVDRSDTIDHVLGKFHGEERDTILESLTRATAAVESLLTYGIERTMGEFNSGS